MLRRVVLPARQCRQFHGKEELLRPNGAAKIALFVDGDNVPATKLLTIMGMLMGYGNIVQQNCYIAPSSSRRAQWQYTSQKFALRLTEVEVAKEAVDIRMAFDVANLLHKNIVSTFALVTGDSDFSPLASHIKLNGGICFAFGMAKATNAHFRRSVDQFFSLETGNQAENLSALDALPEKWTPVEPIKRKKITGQSALAAEFIAKADIHHIKAPFQYQEPMDLPGAIFENVTDTSLPLINKKAKAVIPETSPPKDVEREMSKVRFEEAQESHRHYQKVDSFNKSSPLEVPVASPFKKTESPITPKKKVDDAFDLLKDFKLPGT